MNQRIKTTDFYSSSDLALVAALALFYPIEAVDRQNPYKAFFLFKRTEDLDALIESYFRGEMRVSPALYFNQLKSIKSRLYSERREDHEPR